MTEPDARNSSALKERVGHQVENRRIPCPLHAKREEHVANLAHGRVSERTRLMSVCTQRRKTGQQQRNRSNNAHQMQNFRRHQEQAVGTGDQVDTRGYHCCSVDQRAETGVGPAIASASHACNGN